MIKPKMPSPIHRRVITTSISIILVFTVALGLVLNQLYNKSYLALYSSDLLSAVPQIVGELKRDNLLEIDASRIHVAPENRAEMDSVESDYMAFICQPDKSLFWMSGHAKGLGLSDICQVLPYDLVDPELIMYNTHPYVVHEIAEGSGLIEDKFFVVREVAPQLERLSAIKRKTWFYLGMLFIATTALLYAASYWSFSPLRKLAGELNEIAESRLEKLNTDYPSELEDVTDALNRMIELRKEQTQRYRHAMDDLAHSLKSRLAATNALLDDSALSREMMSKRIVEQVSQMDDMVQYQLKRALVGQRGLVREKSEIKPSVDSLTGMLSKVYRDKPVNVTQDFRELESLPLNKNDLTELLGNLLENAFRFCISEVRVRTRDTVESYILLIEDDGPGIPEPIRDSVFQRGVRADQLNPGTGIGLAVCHEIVESYEGVISVTTSELEGVAFVIQFPKQR
ncbi:ATP-binding protein [Enterovibrio norvegicus]|uniref:ATP-binding protein n=1 Tax=Enterovibrio norvegicus TaxID=188144 RepID=UPI000C858C9A|nr:ATP-binding protein [Enterovibrio norvegicus]PMH67376.1 histidine kinase [Enterovibrio norvegicus]